MAPPPNSSSSKPRRPGRRPPQPAAIGVRSLKAMIGSLTAADVGAALAWSALPPKEEGTDPAYWEVRQQLLAELLRPVTVPAGQGAADGAADGAAAATCTSGATGDTPGLAVNAEASALDAQKLHGRLGSVLPLFARREQTLGDRAGALAEGLGRAVEGRNVVAVLFYVGQIELFLTKAAGDRDAISKTPWYRAWDNHRTSSVRQGSPVTVDDDDDDRDGKDVDVIDLIDSDAEEDANANTDTDTAAITTVKEEGSTGGDEIHADGETGHNDETRAAGQNKKGRERAAPSSHIRAFAMQMLLANRNQKRGASATPSTSSSGEEAGGDPSLGPDQHRGEGDRSGDGEGGRTTPVATIASSHNTDEVEEMSEAEATAEVPMPNPPPDAAAMDITMQLLENQERATSSVLDETESLEEKKAAAKRERARLAMADLRANGPKMQKTIPCPNEGCTMNFALPCHLSCHLRACNRHRSRNQNENPPREQEAGSGGAANADDVGGRSKQTLSEMIDVSSGDEESEERAGQPGSTVVETANKSDEDSGQITTLGAGGDKNINVPVEGAEEEERDDFLYYDPRDTHGQWGYNTKDTAAEPNGPPMFPGCRWGSKSWGEIDERQRRRRVNAYVGYQLRLVAAKNSDKDPGQITAEGDGALVAGTERDYVGCKVAKEFSGIIHHGIITMYTASTLCDDDDDDDDIEDLWRVKYDDGDEEDYNRQELLDAITLQAQQEGSAGLMARRNRTHQQRQQDQEHLSASEMEMSQGRENSSDVSRAPKRRATASSNVLSSTATGAPTVIAVSSVVVVVGYSDPSRPLLAYGFEEILDVIDGIGVVFVGCREVVGFGDMKEEVTAAFAAATARAAA